VIRYPKSNIREDKLSKTAVVTDSTVSLPQSLLEDLGIHQVAYYIHRGTEVLRDLVNIQRNDFLKWLPTAEKLPTTASPGPGDYLTLYEKLANEGTEEIVSIHMTSKGSGAYQAARAAKDMLMEKLPRLRIEVIDTLNVSLCQGWMVIEAARSALAGMNLAGITKKVKGMIPISQMIQTADTLRYLYMGGRIGRAARLVGSLLNLKPLISMQDGEIVALGATRGLTKAYQKMVDLIETKVGAMGKIKIAYVHAGALKEIEILKSMVEKQFTVMESLVAELSPALMVHTGPGTSGLCYYPVDK
jgi:DegV family protein with EDD domain